MQNDPGHPEVFVFKSLYLLLPHHVHDFRVRRRPRRRTLMVELARSVIPVQMSHAAVSIFVGVGRSVILIHHELGVGSRLDAYLRDLLYLACALARVPQRENPPGTNEYWQRVNGRVHLDGLSAMKTLVRPIVVPVGPGGKINRAARRALFG